MKISCVNEPRVSYEVNEREIRREQNPRQSLSIANVILNILYKATPEADEALLKNTIRSAVKSIQ